MSRIKTRLFTSTGIGGIYDYKDFIRDNQNIEIISVNLTKYDFVLLTYKV